MHCGPSGQELPGKVYRRALHLYGSGAPQWPEMWSFFLSAGRSGPNPHDLARAMHDDGDTGTKAWVPSGPGIRQRQHRRATDRSDTDPMENSFPVALSRQQVLARQMDTIATNLANINTAGFKAEQMIFTEFLDRTGIADGQPLSMVHDVAFLRDMSEGPLHETGNPLDLAIHGDGFFVIETDNGPRYTRHGAFQLDNQGRIVTLEGRPVLNETDSPIFVPPDTSTITIARDGTVSADTQVIGKIQVVTFETPQLLSKEGNGLYDAGEQRPQPAGEAEIMQGMIETSNVQAVAEMTRMIKVLRSYQSAAQLAETEHQRIMSAIEAIIGRA